MNINEQILDQLKAMNANMAAVAQQNAMGAVDVLSNDPVVPREDWLMIPIELDLDANDTQPQSVLISQESSFDLIYLTGHVENRPQEGAPVPVLPNLRFRISDGKDKYLTRQGAWTHWLDVIGAQAGVSLATPNAPYTLVGRRRFVRGSNVTFEFNDLSGVDSTVRIVMHGIMVYAQYADQR